MFYHPFTRSPACCSDRRAAAWLALGLAALAPLLARGGILPVGAQSKHTHNWTAHTPPQVSYRVVHADSGLDVDARNPAEPCEVLRIELNSGTEDRDRCDAVGCPIPDGEAVDTMARDLRWRDHGAPGKFVSARQNGKWAANEYVDLADDQSYGSAGSMYYRVGENQPTPGAVTLESEADDTGNASHPNGNTIPAYDDPPKWQLAVTFPVAAR